MIAYLVTEIEVSGRAVSVQDLRQIKKWAHNQGAVLRRAAQTSSDMSAIEDFPLPLGSTSQIARGAKKRAKTSAVVTGVGEDRIHSVPVREHRGHAFLIRIGLLRRGILLKQVVVPPCRVVLRAVLRLELSPHREWTFMCRLLWSKPSLTLPFLLSLLPRRLFRRAAWLYSGATARRSYSRYGAP